MYPDILTLLNSNDQKEIEKFLNNIESVLVVDKYGYIPIVEITRSPRGLEHLKFLINKISDWSGQDQHGNKVIDLVLNVLQQQAYQQEMQNDYLELFEILLKNGANASLTLAQNNLGLNTQSVVFQVLQQANKQALELLIKHKVDLNKASNNQLPINVVLYNGTEEIIDLLLENGVNLNPEDIEITESPLSIAARSNNNELFNKLLKFGAKANPPLHHTTTPLLEAIKINNKTFVNTLIKEKAEINPINEMHDTPLVAAIRIKDLDLIKYLIAEKAEIYPSNSMNFPVTEAVNTHDQTIVKLILESSSNIKQYQLMDALYNALNGNNTEIAELLLPKITAINVKIQNGLFNYCYLLERTHNSESAKLIIDKFGDKITAQHFKHALDSGMNNEVILEALLKSAGDDKTELLLYGIKYDYKLAEKLLYDEKIEIEETKILKAILDSTKTNWPIISILLQNKLILDWNQPLDQEGNTLLMKMAQNNQHDFVQSFIGTTDATKMPIFNVNTKNKNDEKIIDIYRLKYSVDGQLEYLNNINLLRQHGSLEPQKAIVPLNSKIDIQNLHDMVNHNSFNTIQKNLQNTYKLDKEGINNNLKDLENYIAENKESIISALSEHGYNKLVKNFNTFSKSKAKQTDFGSEYYLCEELAYVWLEIKELKNEQGLLKILSEVYACYWGQIINIYKLIEKPDTKEVIPVVDLKGLSKDVSKMNNLFDNIIKKMVMDYGFNDEVLKKVCTSFYEDSCKKYKSVSVESSLFLKFCNEEFFQLVLENNKLVSEIYSADINNFIKDIIGYVMSEYEYTDDEDANSFYQILTASDNDEKLPRPFSWEPKITDMFQISEDLNNLFLDQLYIDYVNKQELEESFAKLYEKIIHAKSIQDFSEDEISALNKLNKALDFIILNQGYIPTNYLNSLGDGRYLESFKVLLKPFDKNNTIHHNMLFEILSKNLDSSKEEVKIEEIKTDSSFIIQSLEFIKSIPEMFKDLISALAFNITNNNLNNKELINRLYHEISQKDKLSNDSQKIVKITEDTLVEFFQAQGVKLDNIESNITINLIQEALKDISSSLNVVLVEENIVILGDNSIDE